jgi:hypothetical protein
MLADLVRRLVRIPESADERRKYSAACFDLKMTIVTDRNGWNVLVRERAEGKSLYTSRQRTLEAAKKAATEFAALRMTGAMAPATVKVMSEHLPWNEI